MRSSNQESDGRMMNKQSEQSLMFGIMAGLFLAVSMGGLLVGYLSGKSSGIHVVRTEAVEANHARWIVAPNGTTTFEWNKQ
jgi:hypothetical protein